MTTQFCWMIEAPGPHYLRARVLSNCYDFCWTPNPHEGLRFYSKEQADVSMMAIRGLAPALFAFALTLGDARPVEHGFELAAFDAAEKGNGNG